MSINPDRVIMRIWYLSLFLLILNGCSNSKEYRREFIAESSLKSALKVSLDKIPLEATSLKLESLVDKVNTDLEETQEVNNSIDLSRRYFLITGDFIHEKKGTGKTGETRKFSIVNKDESFILGILLTNRLLEIIQFNLESSTLVIAYFTETTLYINSYQIIDITHDAEA